MGIGAAQEVASLQLETAGTDPCARDSRGLSLPKTLSAVRESLIWSLDNPSMRGCYQVLRDQRLVVGQPETLDLPPVASENLDSCKNVRSQ